MELVESGTAMQVETVNLVRRKFNGSKCRKAMDVQ